AGSRIGCSGRAWWSCLEEGLDPVEVAEVLVLLPHLAQDRLDEDVGAAAAASAAAATGGVTRGGRCGVPGCGLSHLLEAAAEVRGAGRGRGAPGRATGCGAGRRGRR